MVWDLVVVGGGPGGLALAASAAEAGLRVAALAGSDAPWTPVYAGWGDEVEALGLDDVVACRWSRAAVVLPGVGGPRRHTLDRAYVRLDGRALRRKLLLRLGASGVNVAWRRAISVAHAEELSTVRDDAGAHWQARLVVSAAGASDDLVVRHGGAQHAQVAVGVTGALRDAAGRFPLDPDEALFMDWRPVGGDASPCIPSFLYGLPLGDGVAFVEETVLVRRGPVSLPLLRERLMRRLAARGWRVDAVQHEELCVIPMDLPLPRPDSRVGAYGAAAGSVHPATGYSVLASLSDAPRVAGALAADIGRGCVGPELSAAFHRHVWPSARRRVRALQRYGMGLLAGLDTSATADFFDAFFQMPDARWRRYLAHDASPSEVVATMAAMLRHAEPATRARLFRGPGLLGELARAGLASWGAPSAPAPRALVSGEPAPPLRSARPGAAHHRLPPPPGAPLAARPLAAEPTSPMEA